MTGAALLLALLVGLQDATANLPPGAEGALLNDVFLPFDRPADEGFATGDEALRRARAASEDAATVRDSERLYYETFDAWRAAYVAAPPGSAVRHPAERGPESQRLTLSVETALAARITELSTSERVRWRGRVDELAVTEERLARRDPGALASVEAGFPGTKAAARAALTLGDRAIAAGRHGDARRWVERARQHEALLDDADNIDSGKDFAAALAARNSWLDKSEPITVDDVWTGGDRLVPLGTLSWPSQLRLDRGLPKPGPGRGVRPGAVALDDGRLIIQTSTRVQVIAVDSGVPRQESSFEPAELLADKLERPPDVRRADGAPGWPLLPATNGREVVLVQGRAEFISLQRLANEPIPNALVCLLPPPPTAGVLSTEELPELRWAMFGDLLLGSDGVVKTEPRLAELRGAEIQPGPLIIDGTVVVQARSLEAEVRAWLIGLDLHDGSLRWLTFLAKGTDLAEEQSRFSTGRVKRNAGQPLAELDNSVFAGTHLGSGHLVDPLDGRLRWSLRPRRREPASQGWTGDRPSITRSAAGDVLHWAAADSDRLYRLLAAPKAGEGAASLFAAPPLPIGEARGLLGGDGDAVVVLGRAGPEEAVFAVTEGGARRLDAVFLGRSEEFKSVGALGARRAVVSSDRGVYLFDLDRELYLADYQGLDPIGESSGGEVFLTRDLVVIVGTHGLWLFRAVR